MPARKPRTPKTPAARRKRPAMPGAGRPSLGPDARTIPVTVKVSERELAAIKAEIAPDGKVSDWIRAHGIPGLTPDGRFSSS